MSSVAPSRQYLPPLPPVPSHCFDRTKLRSWDSPDHCSIPIFDVNTAPFWARLNNHVPYLTALCKSCHDVLRDVIHYRFLPNVNAIPTAMTCRCAEIPPPADLVTIPENPQIHQVHKGVSRRYKHEPTILAPLPFGATPSRGLGLEYPLGKTLPLGDDPNGSPSFGFEYPVRFPPDGIAPYLLSARQFLSWGSVYFPASVAPHSKHLYEDMQQIYDFVTEKRTVNHRFTRSLTCPPVTLKEKEYYDDTIVLRFNERCAIYNALARSSRRIYKVLLELQYISCELEDIIPLNWRACQLYNDPTLKPWHHQYYSTIQQGLTDLEDVSTHLMAIPSDTVRTKDPKSLADAFQTINDSFDTPLPFTSNSPRWHPHFLLDDIFGKLHAKTMQIVADQSHYMARSSRKFFLLAHAYSACAYASEHPRLSEISSERKTFDPMQLPDKYTPGKLTVDQRLTAFRSTENIVNEDANSKALIRLIYPPYHALPGYIDGKGDFHTLNVIKYSSPFYESSDSEPDDEDLHARRVAAVRTPTPMPRSPSPTPPTLSPFPPSESFDWAESLPPSPALTTDDDNDSDIGLQMKPIATSSDVETTRDDVHNVDIDADDEHDDDDDAPAPQGAAAVCEVTSASDNDESCRPSLIQSLQTIRESIDEAFYADGDDVPAVTPPVHTPAAVGPQTRSVRGGQRDMKQRTPVTISIKAQDMGASSTPLPVHQLLARQTELSPNWSPNFISGSGVFWRKHPWMAYTLDRTWDFNQLHLPVAAPFEITNPMLNRDFPRLPMDPPPEFTSLYANQDPKVKWAELRIELGAICMIPSKCSDPKEKFITTLSQDFSEQADDTEKMCWMLERSRRPVVFSHEQAYTFAEDDYPMVLPLWLTDAVFNAHYPFLPPSPPDNYRRLAEDRDKTWAQLCARFGTIFNIGTRECLHPQSAVSSYAAYLFYMEKKKNDATIQPTTCHDIYIPVTTSWIFDSNGLPLGISTAHVPADPSMGPPTPIMAFTVPQGFFPTKPMNKRNHLWQCLMPVLNRLQALGFPRRYDLVSEALAYPTTRPGIKSPKPFTYSNIKCCVNTMTRGLLEHAFNRPFRPRYDEPTPSDKTKQEASLPFLFQPQRRLPHHKRPAGAYLLATPSGVTPLSTFNRDSFGSPMWSGIYTPAITLQNPQPPPLASTPQPTPARRRRHTNKPPIIHLTPTKIAPAPSAAAASTPPVQPPAPPAPTPRHRNQRRKATMPPGTVFTYILALIFLLPVALCHSVLARHQFLYIPHATEVNINPSYHTVARRIDVSGIQHLLFLARQISNSEVRLCLDVAEPRPRKLYKYISMRQVRYQEAADTCKSHALSLPTPETQEEFKAMTHHFEESRLSWSWISLSDYDDFNIYIQSEPVDYRRCNKLKNLFEKGSASTVRIHFYLYKWNGVSFLCGDGSDEKLWDSKQLCEAVIKKPTTPSNQTTDFLLRNTCLHAIHTGLTQINQANALFKPYRQGMIIPERPKSNSSEALHLTKLSVPPMAPPKTVRRSTTQESTASGDVSNSTAHHGVSISYRFTRAAATIAGMAAVAGIGFGTASIVNLFRDDDVSDELELLSAQIKTLQLADEYLADAIDTLVQAYNNLSAFLYAELTTLKRLQLLNFMADAISDLTADVFFMVDHLSNIITAARSDVVFPSVLDQHTLKNISIEYHNKHLLNLVTDVDKVQISVVRTTHDYYAVLRIPIFQPSTRATIFEVTPIPAFRDGERITPVYYPPLLAIFDHGFHYAPVTEAEYQQCLRPHRPCLIKSPVFDRRHKMCGASNYLEQEEDVCTYIRDPVQHDWYRSITNVTYFSVRKPDVLNIKCPDRDKITPSYTHRAQVSDVGFLTIDPHCTATTSDGTRIFASDPSEHQVQDVKTIILPHRSAGFSTDVFENMTRIMQDLDVQHLPMDVDTVLNLPRFKHAREKQLWTTVLIVVAIILVLFVVPLYVACRKYKRFNFKRKDWFSHLNHLQELLPVPPRPEPPSASPSIVCIQPPREAPPTSILKLDKDTKPSELAALLPDITDVEAGAAKDTSYQPLRLTHKRSPSVSFAADELDKIRKAKDELAAARAARTPPPTPRPTRCPRPPDLALDMPPPPEPRLPTFVASARQGPPTSPKPTLYPIKDI